MKTIGVTATRKGLTKAQLIQVEAILDPGDEVHHGGAIGGDEQIHHIALCTGCKIIVHRSNRPDQSAECEGAAEYRDPKDPKERDLDIVKEGRDLLVVCPAGPEKEYPRSGTWYTKRLADIRGVPVYLIYPDGSRYLIPSAL